MLLHQVPDAILEDQNILTIRQGMCDYSGDYVQTWHLSRQLTIYFPLLLGESASHPHSQMCWSGIQDTQQYCITPTICR